MPPVLPIPDPTPAPSNCWHDFFCLPILPRIGLIEEMAEGACRLMQAMEGAGNEDGIQTRSSRQGGGCARAALGLALALASLFASRLHADTIYLKNGSTISGIVDKAASDPTRVIIKTTNGTIPVHRSKIDRIESRENMTLEEQKGDLAAHANELDRALSLYLEAEEKDPASEELSKKVADIRRLIKERDDKRFGQQFDKIEKLIEARQFDPAIGQALQLRARVDTDSVRARCNELTARAYLDRPRLPQHRQLPQGRKVLSRGHQRLAAGRAGLELADLVQTYPTRQLEAIDLYRQGLEIARKDPSVLAPGKMLAAQFNYAKLHYNNSQYRKAALLFWRRSRTTPRRNTPPPPISPSSPAAPSRPSSLRIPRRTSRSLTSSRPSPKSAQRRQGPLHPRQGLLQPGRLREGHPLPRNRPQEHEQLQPRPLRLRVLPRHRVSPPEQATGGRQPLQGVSQATPKRYEAICELAELYFDIADYPGALDQFQRGIEVEPKQYRAFLGGGRTLRRIDRNEDAAVMYEELIKIKDDEPEFYYELGLTYFNLNKHEDSLRIYQKYVELTASADKSDPKIVDRLAEVFSNMGQSNIALKQNNEALEKSMRSLSSFTPIIPPPSMERDSPIASSANTARRPRCSKRPPPSIRRTPNTCSIRASSSTSS